MFVVLRTILSSFKRHARLLKVRGFDVGAHHLFYLSAVRCALALDVGGRLRRLVYDCGFSTLLHP